MRNDPIFKFVAAIVVAGVLTALAAPAHTPSPTASTAVTVAAPTQTTEGAQ